MRITRDQLEVFERYGGDYDGIYRYNDVKGKELFDNNDSWGTISLFVEDILLIDRKLVSGEYRNRALKEIENGVDKGDVDLLYKIARDISLL